MTLATGVLFLAQVLGHLVVERLFDQLTFGCFTRTINCICPAAGSVGSHDMTSGDIASGSWRFYPSTP
ncbi:hypothetical protein ACWJKQ_22045 [Xanthomonas axonopodis pv. cassiae]